MMRFDRITLGRQAKELGFVRDTFEKVCRLADVLSFMESDGLLADSLALKGGTAINLTIFDLPRLSVDIDLDFSKDEPILVSIARKTVTPTPLYTNILVHIGYFLSLLLLRIAAYLIL